MEKKDLKFKLDDRIKIIVGKFKGKIGIIADVDEDWMFPYEVMLDDGKIVDELFEDKDLALLGETMENDLDEVETVSMLINKLNELQRSNPSYKTTMALTKLIEAKMWLNEKE